MAHHTKDENTRSHSLYPLAIRFLSSRVVLFVNRCARNLSKTIVIPQLEQSACRRCQRTGLGKPSEQIEPSSCSICTNSQPSPWKVCRSTNPLLLTLLYSHKHLSLRLFLVRFVSSAETPRPAGGTGFKGIPQFGA